MKLVVVVVVLVVSFVYDSSCTHLGAMEHSRAAGDSHAV